jgi:hypothetical protein
LVNRKIGNYQQRESEQIPGAKKNLVDSRREIPIAGSESKYLLYIAEKHHQRGIKQISRREINFLLSGIFIA